jgi:hypothetical protein
MRIATLAIAASAALVVMTSGALAQPAGLDGSYDPAEMSDEVKARPQTQGATGDQQRHYWFEEAGVEMPYRIYVPASYDPGTPTPLVVALHGYAGDQDYFFRFARDVPSKSDEHGFIFVAPMGYNPAPVIASSHRIMKSWPPSRCTSPSAAKKPGHSPDTAKPSPASVTPAAVPSSWW